jgi:hypothetical protein
VRVPSKFLGPGIHGGILRTDCGFAGIVGAKTAISVDLAGSPVRSAITRYIVSLDDVRKRRPPRPCTSGPISSSAMRGVSVTCDEAQGELMTCV